MKTVDIGKNVTLFIDFNNLFIRNFFGAKEIYEDSNDIQWGLLFYNVFNSIYTSLFKFKNIEEVILAIDDRNSWRKSYYNRYKESRKEKKKESRVDWIELYKMMNKLASEFQHHMPFKILKVKNSEADDIIAVLIKYMKNPCVIIARDEDYFQLFAKKNLRIYDPISQTLYNQKDFPDVENFIKKLVFCGQSKDDIPNILTPNDWGLTEETKNKRKPGFGEKAFEKIKNDIENFINKGYKNPIYGNVDLEANLKRNKILIDFNKIPNTIIDRILKAYNHSHNLPPLDNIYLWFEKYSMRSFMENAHNITNKLQTLY